MPIPLTQDLVHGQDFTAINPQTALQHNQLVDQATPYAVDDSNGVALVLVTTDTNLDIPDVPNPTIDPAHAKWKRYSWVRRPYATSPDSTSILYAWNDAAVDDATFRKWQPVDITSQTAVPQGYKAVNDAEIHSGVATLISTQAAFTQDDIGKYVTGVGIPDNTKVFSWSILTPNQVIMDKQATADINPAIISIIFGQPPITPLQASLDKIGQQSANAVATASGADTKVNNLQAACIGLVPVGAVVPDLLTQINLVEISAAANTTSIHALNQWANGADTDVPISPPSINIRIADLQTQITNNLAASKLVSNLTESTIIGALIRTSNNAGVAGDPEWFDPIGVTEFLNYAAPIRTVTALTNSAIITFDDGTGTSATGTPKITAPTLPSVGTFEFAITFTVAIGGTGATAGSLKAVLNLTGGITIDTTVAPTIGGLDGIASFTFIGLFKAAAVSSFQTSTIVLTGNSLDTIATAGPTLNCVSMYFRRISPRTV